MVKTLLLASVSGATTEPTRYPPQVLICCLVAGLIFGALWGLTRALNKQAPAELLLVGAIVSYILAYRVGVLWEYGKDYLSDLLPLIIHAGALCFAAWLGRLAMREVWGKIRHKGVENE